MEKTIYTSRWASGLAKDFMRDLFRSALFAGILLVGFLGVILMVGPSEEMSSFDESVLSISEFFALAVFSFFFLVLCCYIALFFVADDKKWGIQEPPRVWDDQEERWITSTVSFAHYLEARGSHIQTAMVQYDDPRMTAHRMIDKIDDRTLQLYLSILSAVQLERERVKVESVEVKPKSLNGTPRQG